MPYSELQHVFCTPKLPMAAQSSPLSAGSALGGGDWAGGASDRPSGGGGRGAAAPQAERAYGEQTLRSLDNIEEAQLNYDLVRATRRYPVQRASRLLDQAVCRIMQLLMWRMSAGKESMSLLPGAKAFLQSKPRLYCSPS